MDVPHLQVPQGGPPGPWGLHVPPPGSGLGAKEVEGWGRGEEPERHERERRGGIQGQ